jgi:hypothetical protein
VAIAAEASLQISGTSLQIREGELTMKQEPRDPAA